VYKRARFGHISLMFIHMKFYSIIYLTKQQDIYILLFVRLKVHQHLFDKNQMI